MSRINYNKNASQLTEYNYSFCDDEELSNKENINYNGNYLYKKIDDLERIIKRQYNLQIKSNTIIKQQSIAIQKMKQSIDKIQRKVKISPQSNLPHKSISSISKNESAYSQSIDYFHSRVATKTSKRHSSNKSRESTNKIKSSISNSKNKDSSGTSNFISSEDEENNAKLLSTIVQRKLNIQKELKERLRNHMMNKNQKKTLKTSVNYITYATEK